MLLRKWLSTSDALIALMLLDIQYHKYLQNGKNRLQMKENKTLPGVTITILRLPCR